MNYPKAQENKTKSFEGIISPKDKSEEKDLPL